MLVSVYPHFVEVDDDLCSVSPDLLFEVPRRLLIYFFKFQSMLVPDILDGRYLDPLRQFLRVNFDALQLQLLGKLFFLLIVLLH